MDYKEMRGKGKIKGGNYNTAEGASCVSLSYHDHPVLRRLGQHFAPGGLAPGDGGPGAVAAGDGAAAARGGGGVAGGRQLEVVVAGDVDGLAVADGGAGAHVGGAPLLDVGHDARGQAVRNGVGPLAVGL